ncbi:MAG: aminomethyl-transferring glycine dehydrogenase subunit GcvPB [Tissierellia bacterium]|nr:aminomethyl-transferring glycine dehydrogenase subunit GcvPB [Tissierellia bacterium]
MKKQRPLIFEISKEGRRAYRLPALDVEPVPVEKLVPKEYLADSLPDLPNLSELEVVRHYTNLSKLNYGIDSGYYPLGSCTMKYNPKLNEWAARLPGFANLHPHQLYGSVQGLLKLLYELDGMLCEIAGMNKFTLQPAAGAHGELTGIMIIRKYHEDHGEGHRNIIIVPDSAHGTNPATAAMAGYEILEIKSDSRGLVDVEELRKAVNENVAGLMLTNPNTLGLFEKDIKEIAEIVHGVGGLLYYDGANANAILGHARPGDMGFDVVHFNLHKTFSTPHGGGGPGAGPVGVVEKLKEYLPTPTIEWDEVEDFYYWNYDIPYSIGRMKDFYGHVGVLIRAYTYILTLGGDGLYEASTKAVLNANYLSQKLKDKYNLPKDTICKHEFVLAGLKNPGDGVITLDVAKRLMDFGYHPPTVYFPLIIDQALMIEPTETESKETLDGFVEAMNKIADEAISNPEMLKTAPHGTPIGRPDETLAARKPVLSYKKPEEKL